MTGGDPIREGQILTGPLFSEPMRVETVIPNGPSAWTVGAVGTQTERFRRVALTKDQLATLTITSPAPSHAGDGEAVRLGLQAYALGIAWEFDPYFGLSVSRVDPLPHQLEAVYDYLLKLARVRFLLADDAGAGKTIMAGLLIRELKLRGLIERVLIVTPANLAFQWQRELNEKFDEKFLVLRGADLRVQFGVNPWLEHPQILTSLDLAKREEILPSLRQSHWDLIVVDEAHRMSAVAEDKKSLRYKLGELLREITDHYLLLTATPHRGDPENFSLFLQLLDPDAFADVRSIRQAMDQRRAPFYLRRTKEAMVYFPERQPDGTWAARKIFTKRIPHSVEFAIDGEEFRLYRDVTAFVKAQSSQAAAQGEDIRARAVGFLMALYQRRLASSTYAVRRSLENRVRRLREGLRRASDLARQAPPDLPTPDELEEMEDHERERLEAILEAITITQNPRQIEAEIGELARLGEQALAVERAGVEAKLGRLQRLLREEGFFDHPDERLLIFTEFKDTLEYLVQTLTGWGFRVGFIHGGMKPGSREEPGTRLHAEQQFRDGAIQVLVATEAAGEGINLQVCHMLVNFDIPWNPNRLEQRMGRIHRYGQTKDCLIFNFVATNTIEGRVLRKLLDKLQEIRDALDDDAVFNVVGEVLPAAHMERVLRDYYAGRLGEQDLEERLLRHVNEGSFRAICQNALEGLATKQLNLAMLVERRAKAQERRLVPETIARFLRASAGQVPMALREVKALSHTFDPGPTPGGLRRYEQDADWRLPTLVGRYPRISTDRETADTQHLEWVTPGHPLFEALRRHALDRARPHFAQGACFYALDAAEPARLDVYRARIVDGLGHVIHERLFAVRLVRGQEPALLEVGVLGNLQPAPVPDPLPRIALEPESLTWLHAEALQPFLAEVKADRGTELDRIAAHIELSLTELIDREDRLIGRLMEDRDRGVEGAAGNLARAEERQSALLRRRDRRREELQRQRALSLQAVERVTTALVLPHPEAARPDVRRLRPDPETEAAAMRVAMDYERAQARAVADVHEQNLGYDLTSLDTQSGELRLIEVKGIGEATGTVLLTPNERRVAEDRRDCYWLYVVTHCRTAPQLQEPIKDPARLPWHEVRKVDHYWLAVDALTQPMRVREAPEPYEGLA
jgi:superfamily II DNA or RNA helicase